MPPRLPKPTVSADVTGAAATAPASFSAEKAITVALPGATATDAPPTATADAPSSPAVVAEGEAAVTHLEATVAATDPGLWRARLYWPSGSTTRVALAELTDEQIERLLAEPRPDVTLVADSGG